MRSLTGFCNAWLLTVLLFITLSCSRANTGCSASQPPDVGLTVAQGVAYIGFGSVVAVHASDGSQLWKTSVSGDTTFSTLSNGVLYVGDGASLTALNSSDGKPLWQYKGAGGYYRRLKSGDPPLVSDGAVYVASTTQIAAVQASDGKVLWQYPITEKYAPRFALNQQTVYVDGGTTLTALQASNGQLRWKVQQPSYGFTVSTSSNQVYLYEANAVVALRTSDGQQLWSFPLTATPGFIYPMSTSPIISAAGTIYVGAQPTLYALRERDGKLLWSVPTAVSYLPTIANNVLYTLVGSKISALNARTGTVLWQSSSESSNFIVDPDQSALYTYGGDAAKAQHSDLLALKMSDGSVLWTDSNVSGPLRLASNGAIYLASSVGGCSQPNTADVSAVQTSDGHRQWHVQL